MGDIVPTCTNCGAEVPQGAAFCATCGASIAASPPASTDVLPAPSGQTRQPVRLTEVDYRTCAQAAGLTLAVYLSVCSVIAAAVALLAGSDGHRGNAFDWVRAGILLAAAGLHGSLFSSVRGSDGGGSFSVTATPLLVFALVVALAHWSATRAERRTPSRDARTAVYRGILSGAGAAVVLAVLAKLGTFSDGFGVHQSDQSVRVGASVAPLLLRGTVILGSTFALSRVKVQRATQQLAPLSGLLAQRTYGVAPWVRAMAAHAALTAVLLTVSGIVYGILSSDHEVHDSTGSFTSSDVAGLFVLVLLLPNIALAAVGFFLGFGFHLAGVATFLGSGSATVGLLHGGIPAKTYLWCLAPLAAAIVVGVRQALRPRQHGSMLDDWWRAGVGSLAFWLPAALLVRVSFGGGGGSGSDGLSGSVSYGFSLVSLLLLAFGWGVVVMVLGRVLLPPVAQAFPGLTERLAGPDNEQRLQPGSPMTARSRTTLLILGVVAGLVVSLGVAYKVVDSRVYGPSGAVDSYLADLESGHVSDALTHVDSVNLGDRTLLTDAALPSGTRPTEHRVNKVDVHGDLAEVEVSYRLNGKTVHDRFSLRKKGRTAVLFHTWQIVGGIGELQISASSSVDAYEVNGIRVAAGNSTVSIPALPGSYTVSVAAGGLLTGSSADVEVTSDGGDTSVDVQLSAEATDQARQAVLSYLTSCLARARTLTTSCGPTSYVYGDRYEGIHWTLTTEPQLEVSLEESNPGQLRISSSSDGSAHVTGTAIPDFLGTVQRQPINENATFSVYGVVDLSGTTPLFTPSTF